MKINSYIYLNSSIILLVDRGRPLTVQADHPQFSNIVSACRESRWSEAINLACPELDIARYSNHEVFADNGLFYLSEDPRTPLPKVLGNRMYELYHQGLDISPIKAFWKALQTNPDVSIRDRLYKFLEDHEAPILANGDILLYKRVAPDLTSLTACPAGCQEPHEHTNGRIQHTLGKEVLMKRSSVDSNSFSECSCGLHTASYNYAKSFYMSEQGVVLEVRVNPRDVCAIPADANGQKMRVCQYLPTAVNQYGPWEFAPDQKKSGKKPMKLQVGTGKAKLIKTGKPVDFPVVNSSVYLQPSVLTAAGLKGTKLLVVVNRKKCGSIQILPGNARKKVSPTSVVVGTEPVTSRGLRVLGSYLVSAGIQGDSTVVVWDKKNSCLRVRQTH